MKPCMRLAGLGPRVILTSYDSVNDPGLVEKPKAKSMEQSIAREIPRDPARQRHDGNRAFRPFRFSEPGPPVACGP